MINEMRDSVLKIVQGAMSEKIICGQDIGQFMIEEDISEPEYVRFEMEKWYRNRGIEDIIGREFSLRLPYFSKKEIEEALDNEEIILCVPKGVTLEQFGTLFHLESWALSDTLITNTTEAEDFWFKTKKVIKPENCGMAGRELKTVYGKEGKLGMNLGRYMVYVARMRYLYQQTPDIGCKTWLINGNYEKNSMLIVGFDSQHKLSVHAWLPQFHSPKVGGRYVIIPDHHYI